MTEWSIDNLLDSFYVSQDNKKRISDIIKKTPTANRLAIRQYAVEVFTIIDPAVDKDIMLSSTKHFDRINYTKKQVRSGLHILRSYFAHMISAAHRRENGYTTRYSVEYEEYGIVTIENFLNENLRNNVIKEIDKFPLATSKNNDNIIHYMDESCALRKVLDTTSMKTIVFDCLGFNDTHVEANTLYRQNTFVQKLHNKAHDGDVQKVPHTDTFFPCIKWWYFPNEVSASDGPFAYVPRSNMLSEQRLIFEYDQSIMIVDNIINSKRTVGHAEGSLRVFEEELNMMKLKLHAYDVPANTLVLANVFGFHSRSEVAAEARRNAIHGSIRTSQPFY